MKLFGYFRSSASYRVRIAINLKGLDVGQAAVPLLDHDALSSYRAAINPQGLVPALDSEDGLLVQSMAIIEYLEERFPDPPLLPRSLGDRAYARAAAQLVACDIHPLANLRVLRHLKAMGHSQDEIDDWYRHWVEDGLNRLEIYVAGERRSARYLLGDTPTMADCCLVPQLFNARRLDCNLSSCPTLVAIDARCNDLAAFQAAHPSAQADAF